jgi:RimJ/RimL family protein N-acetyltransferase
MLFTKKRELAPPRRARILARGEATVLREFERPDVDRWLAWPRHRDPFFDSYNPPVLTVRQRDLYYRQRVQSTDSRQYSVDDLAGEFVGRISIREIDWQFGASVLGLSFHPERLNQGLGSDALNSFLGFYFRTLNMNSLFLDVAAFNDRAYRVYVKCGFQRCGERWGEAQADTAGVFRRREHEGVRHLFHWEYGLVRPLLVDMVLRRPDWEARAGKNGS